MGIEKIKFLYLSINSDQASSFASRHSLTSTVSVRKALVAVESFAPEFIVRRKKSLLQIKLFRVPKSVAAKKGRTKVADTLFARDQNIWAY